MQKKIVNVFLSTLLAFSMVACQSMDHTEAEEAVSSQQEMTENETDTQSAAGESNEQSAEGKSNEELAEQYDAAIIELDDSQILVDGKPVSDKEQDAVYTANDIVFYLEDQGFTYGAGSKEDEHSQEEADAHTVVHISKPGNYVISGTLSAGQIAVDLGEDAKKDEEAVVTLILNQMDVTCSVAPAVIFYRVYECGSDEEEGASMDVDTTNAGANVILADGSVNQVNGSYVARIYKSIELNEAGTEVVENKKLHKYDGAFYSKCSMNISGEDKGNGILNIKAENEGLDSELHLTINGGTINIVAGNDGINTNEDNVSVTTINGGYLNIVVDGATGEGDGIDSNGWLVINGGTVIAQACSSSQDAGIDSDMGIYIHGGTVWATGNMYDIIENDSQNFVAFTFDEKQSGEHVYTIRKEDGQVIGSFRAENDFTVLIFSTQELTSGAYCLWMDDTQLSVQESRMDRMMGGGPRPGKGQMEKPDMEGMEKPDMEGTERPDMEGMERPDMEGMERPDMEGMEKPDEMGGFGTGETADTFEITEGGSMYRVIAKTK